MQSAVGRDRRIPPFHRGRRGTTTPPYKAAPDIPRNCARQAPRLHESSLGCGAAPRQAASGLARIFHSLSHRYDHLPASGSYDGGGQGICGLVSKPALRGEIMRSRTIENSCLAQENPRNLAGLPAERSGGGFASSPDVPASALGPRIIDSLHAGCRVERETSGLGGSSQSGSGRRWSPGHGGFGKRPADKPVRRDQGPEPAEGRRPDAASMIPAELRPSPERNLRGGLHFRKPIL